MTCWNFKVFAVKGLIVIDEVQLAPELFQVIRVLIDRQNRPGQFLLLGSASPGLLWQTSESLLGRVEVIEVTGFTLAEVGTERQPALWVRGGFPMSFTAASDEDSLVWRKKVRGQIRRIRFATVWREGRRPHDAAILDDAGALSWPGVECGRTSALARRKRTNCTPVSGLAYSSLYDSAVTTLAREYREAPDQSA